LSFKDDTRHHGLCDNCELASNQRTVRLTRTLFSKVCELASRLTGEVPGCTPAASPWLRRRLSPWSPSPGFIDLAGSPHRHHEWVRTAHQPRSTGFRAGTCSRGVTAPVSLVYLPVSLTAPGPSGSPEPTRLCRGCSHPPRRPPDQAASIFTSPLRQRGNGRSLTSIRKQQQRLVAHTNRT
jgi:hypothetical protein